MRTSNPPLRVVKRILLTILISSSLFYSILAFNQGTYAWFTSGTYAKGTIINATTSDLLNIELTPLDYGVNCSVKSGITITNISTMDTYARVSLQTGDGEILVKEQEIVPGEVMITETTEVGQVVDDSCSLDQVSYKVEAFNGFVSEGIVVPVDPQSLIQPEEEKEDLVDQDVKDKEKEPQPEPQPVTEEPTTVDGSTEEAVIVQP